MRSAISPVCQPPAVEVEVAEDVALTKMRDRKTIARRTCQRSLETIPIGPVPLLPVDASTQILAGAAPLAPSDLFTQPTPLR